MRSNKSGCLMLARGEANIQLTGVGDPWAANGTGSGGASTNSSGGKFGWQVGGCREFKLIGLLATRCGSSVYPGTFHSPCPASPLASPTVISHLFSPGVLFVSCSLFPSIHFAFFPIGFAIHDLMTRHDTGTTLNRLTLTRPEPETGLLYCYYYLNTSLPPTPAGARCWRQ